MKKTFTTPILVFLFFLLNGGLVVSFNMHEWAPAEKIFKTDWFKLLGIAPAFLIAIILYIREKIKNR